MMHRHERAIHFISSNSRVEDQFQAYSKKKIDGALGAAK